MYADDDVPSPDMGTVIKAKSKPYVPGERLAGVTHLGGYLGTTSTWGRQLSTREDFPPPVLSVNTETRVVDYWRPSEVEAWAAGRDAVAPVPDGKQRRPKGWKLDGKAEPKPKAAKPAKAAPAAKAAKPEPKPKAAKPAKPAKATPAKPVKAKRTPSEEIKQKIADAHAAVAVAQQTEKEKRKRPSRAEVREIKAAKEAQQAQPQRALMDEPRPGQVAYQSTTSLADRLAAKAAALQ